MSDKNALPPELAALEQSLTGPRSLPDAALRGRVLAAVQHELAGCHASLSFWEACPASPPSPQVRHPQAGTLEGGTLAVPNRPASKPDAMPLWQYLATLAAGVLLALNASVCFNTPGHAAAEAQTAVALTADDLKLAAELGLSERELRLPFLAVPVGRPVPTAAYRPCVLPKDLTLE